MKDPNPWRSELSWRYVEVLGVYPYVTTTERSTWPRPLQLAHPPPPPPTLHQRRHNSIQGHSAARLPSFAASELYAIPPCTVSLGEAACIVWYSFGEDRRWAKHGQTPQSRKRFIQRDVVISSWLHAQFPQPWLDHAPDSSFF